MSSIAASLEGSDGALEVPAQEQLAAGDGQGADQVAAEGLPFPRRHAERSVDDLVLDIGGISQGTGYSYLAVGGNIELDGLLFLQVINGFESQLAHSGNSAAKANRAQAPSK